MKKRTTSLKQIVIPCRRLDLDKRHIEEYADALMAAAHKIGDHGLTKTEFWKTGLFRSAIETLRGRQAASMRKKKDFLAEVLDHMKSLGCVRSWAFTGAGERHDYEIDLGKGRTVVFEAKGCLDGNNTNIFQRPPNADEFFIWSLCQNPGADPGHNAWSGIHTRLGATLVAEKQRIDGLVIWDMVCGTEGRPCPKLAAEPDRGVRLASGKVVPPPCIYMFPRRIPDPRNNPDPPVWRIEDVKFLKALGEVFGVREDEVTQVSILARMHGADVQRRTVLLRSGVVVGESGWTTVARAVR